MHPNMESRVLSVLHSIDKKKSNTTFSHLVTLFMHKTLRGFTVIDFAILPQLVNGSTIYRLLMSSS